MNLQCDMRRIVLAEDDVDDQLMMEEIIHDLDREIDLSIFDDGEKVMQFMHTLGHNDLPKLIILDQNMPRMKGTETIQGLQEDSKWRHIPTVIYTTYHDHRFAEHCRRNQIELFRKPDTLAELKKMMAYLMAKYLDPEFRIPGAAT
jgi:CheY-like chemotaxis protein